MAESLKVVSLPEQLQAEIGLVPGKKAVKYPVLGAPFCGNLYGAISVLGKVGSGKTVLLFNLLKAFCGPQTKVLIYSATAKNDPLWENIINWLESAGIKCLVRTSIYEGDDKKNQLNHVQEFMQRQKAQKEIDDQKLEEYERKLAGKTIVHSFIPSSGTMEDAFAERAKIEKPFLPTIDPFLVNVAGTLTQYVSTVLVFDDLSSEMKDKFIVQLTKSYRHWRCKVITSSQYEKDFAVAARENQLVWYLFSGIPTKKLEDIWSAVGTTCSFQLFQQRYKYATSDPHSFLRLDRSYNPVRMSKNLKELFLDSE